MKTLYQCLGLALLVGCGSIHGTIVGDSPKDKIVFDYTGTASGARQFADVAQARIDAKTHRMAVKNAGELAMVYAEQGMPASLHEQAGQVDANGGYNLGAYGMQGMPGTYGLSGTAAYAEAMSLSGGQGQPQPLGQQIGPAQAAVPQATPPAICPKGRDAVNDSERVACLRESDKVQVKRIVNLEKK